MIPVASKSSSTPLKVVLPFFIFSAVGFTATGIMIFFSSDSFQLHYFHPRLLAITHTITLAFITSVIFGSVYQMVPVLLEKELFSRSLAIGSFITLLSGSVLLIWTFWEFNTGLLCQIASCLVLLSFILFALNFYLTARNVEKWFIEADLLSLSMLWLVLTGTLGVLLVFNFSYVFIPVSHLEVLKAHAHMGLVGWFFLLIIGAGARLIPMFLISHPKPKGELKVSLVTINLGLLIIATGFYLELQSTVLLTGSALISAGGFAFLIFIWRAYKARVRKKVDITMKIAGTGIFFILVVLLLGLALPMAAGEEIILLEITYGFLALMAACGGLILGLSQKIVPFLVWMNKYKNEIGTRQLPTPAEFLNRKISVAVLTFFLLSIVLITTGIMTSTPVIIKAGGAALFCAGILYLINYGWILRNL